MIAEELPAFMPVYQTFPKPQGHILTRMWIISILCGGSKRPEAWGSFGFPVGNRGRKLVTHIL
jgi:hypothetical protein